MRREEVKKERCKEVKSKEMKKGEKSMKKDLSRSFHSVRDDKHKNVFGMLLSQIAPFILRRELKN